MFKDFCSTYEDIKISYAYYYKKVKKKKKKKKKNDREWTDNENVVSVNLQKVIMLPRLKVKFLWKRIVVFNETFTPVDGSKNGTDKATGVL